MSEQKTNPIVRVGRGVSAVVNGIYTTIRIAILLFLAVALLAFCAVREPGVRDNSALVIAPEGAIVDEKSGYPVSEFWDELLGVPDDEAVLFDLTAAIRSAADDDRIPALVIKPDAISSISPASVMEVAAAVDDFRQSGKPVIAMAEFLTQQQYLLAALADEILLDPEGLVLIEGYSNYRNYFAEALAKLDIDVHLFRAGQYKSAAEPYVRNDMSPAAREAAQSWLADLWGQYVDLVAQRRGMDRDAFVAAVERFPETLEAVGGDPAEAALRAGLVDMLMTVDQQRQRVAQHVAWDDAISSFRQVNAVNYVSPVPNLGAPIAMVVASGEILPGEQPPGTIGGVSTAQLLDDALRDDSIKAVILRVDSPGGAVYPSEQIRRSVRALRAAGKPVVASMGDAAASGGYWIAMNADAIVAAPNTITGSIGVYGLLMTAPRTLDRLGISSDGVGTTSLAGSLRLDRPLQPALEQSIQLIIEGDYETFIENVAGARDQSVDAIDRVAQGRVWSGRQALELGLVDELGGLERARQLAVQLADLDEAAAVRTLQQTTPGFSGLLDALMMKADLAPKLPLEQAWQGPLDMLEATLRSPMTVYAHCLCDPPR